MNLKKRTSTSRLLATFLAVAPLAFGTAASANASSDLHYTVGVIADAAKGRAILKQRYEAAIDKLERSGSKGLKGFNDANNLCVAYLKIGDVANATESCQLAVARIQSIIANGYAPRRAIFSKRDYPRLLALALSNLGVAYAVTEDHEMARDAFAAAIDLKANAREPVRNLARLEEDMS